MCVTSSDRQEGAQGERIEHDFRHETKRAGRRARRQEDRSIPNRYYLSNVINKAIYSRVCIALKVRLAK